MEGFKIQRGGKYQPGDINLIKSVANRRNQIKFNKTINASNQNSLMEENNLMVGSAKINQESLN